MGRSTAPFRLTTLEPGRWVWYSQNKSVKLFGSNLLLTAQNLRLSPPKFEGEKSVFAWPIVGEKSIPTYSSEGEKSLETKEKSSPIVGKNLFLSDSFGGKNPWDALRIARELWGKILTENTPRFGECFIVVRPGGIEPPSQAPQACVLSVELWALNFYCLIVQRNCVLINRHRGR